MTMRVFVPNFSVRTMNYKFRFLITREFSCNFNRFRLCPCAYSCTRICFAFYLPSSIGMRSDMLILTFCHITSILSNKRKG